MESQAATNKQGFKKFGPKSGKKPQRNGSKPKFEKRPFKKREDRKPNKEHAKKKAKKEDYRSLIILTFLKVLKKLKAFGIRKYLRSAKMVAEGDERYHGKETQEQLERTAELFKQVKNNELKAMIPLLAVVELNEDLTKYWPIIEKQVGWASSERHHEGGLQRSAQEVLVEGPGKRIQNRVRGNSNFWRSKNP